MKFFTLTFGVVFVFLTATLDAQSISVHGKSISLTPEIQKELSSRFQHYDLFEINSDKLIAQTKKRSEEITIHWNLGHKYDWETTIWHNSLCSPDYQLRAATPNGMLTYLNGKDKTFSGQIVKPRIGSLGLVLDRGFIYGTFSLSGKTFLIEPVNGLIPDCPRNVFVVYEAGDVKEVDGVSCAWKVTKQRGQSIKKGSTDIEKLDQCYTVEIAIASDFLMYQHFGSVAAVENFTLGVLNNVQTNYDDEFADEIQFQVVTQFVATSASSDPWSSTTVIDDLLEDFAVWGNNGGFNVDYDVASLWSDRDFNGTPIGVAWLSAICDPLQRYNVLQNFSTNAQFLRVLQSHELGHNFSAQHDPPNSFTIMAPSVNSSTVWSNASINSINNYVSNLSNDPNCLSGCVPPAPPVVDIQLPVTHICPGSVLPLIDNSSNNPTSWNWQIGGAVPAFSNEQHPTVVFPDEGTFFVSLTASNATGSDTDFADMDVVVDTDGEKFLLFETFEGGLGAWSTVNPDFSTTWTITNVGGTQYGHKSVFMDNFNYEAGGQVDGLISPPINLEGEGDITLEIDYAYARFNSFNSDQMRIVVSTDGGNTFPFEIFSGEENGSGNFATAPDNQNEFIPTSINDWCYGGGFGANCLSLPLNQFAGEPNVVVKIENINGFGNNLYVDNVRIKSSCSTIAPPVAAISSDLQHGCVPFSVHFFDQSTGVVEERHWVFEGGNPSTSTEANPTVAYNAPGVYSVELTVSNITGSSTTSETDYIVVNDIPTADFVFDLNGFEVFFDNFSENGDTFLWDFGDGQTSTDFNVIHTFFQPGEYTVSLSATNECGTNTIEKTVIILSPLMPAFSADVTTGCPPLTVFFTDESEGSPTGWSWEFEGGSPNSSTEQNPQVEYNSPGVFGVTLTISDATGEQSLVMNDFITILPLPISGFSVQNTLGSGEVTFNSSSENTDSFVWDFGDGNTSTTENPVHTYAEEGTYTVTLTVTNDCGTDSAEQEVTIVFPPQASFTSSATEGCSPMEVTFEASPLGAAYSYEWTFDGGAPSSSTESSPTVVYNTAGSYNVSLTVTNAAGSDTYVQNDVINVGMGAIAGFDFQNTLGSGEVTFNSSSENADSFVWDFGDENTSTTENPVHTYAEEGTYTVTLTVTNDCGSDSAEQEVTIVFPPQASFTSSATEGCSPMEVTFEASPLGAAYSYEWTFDGGAPSSSTESSPTVVYNTAGSYNVSLTVTNPAGSDTYVQNDVINVGMGAIAGFDFQNTLGSGEVTFNSSSENADSFVWDFGDGNTSTMENPVHTYAEEGTYTVTLTVTNDCGSDSAEQEVTIVFPPQASFTSSATEGCSPLEVTFEASPQNDSYSYLWMFNGGIPSSSTEASPTVVFEEPGTYNVSLMVTNIAGSDLSSNVLISVGAAPNAAFDYDNTPGTGFVSFSPSTENVDSYLWDFGDGTGSVEETPIHTYEVAGNYTVALIVTNQCGSDSIEQEVNIVFPPQAGFSTSVDFGCSPMEVTFEASPQGTAYTYEWAFPGGEPANSVESNPTVIYNAEGVYDVTLVVSNELGSDTAIVENAVEVLGMPSVSFYSEVNGTAVQFFVSSEGADAFFWDFGDGTNSEEMSPSHVYSESGVYEVILTAVGTCGEATVSENVIIDTSLPVVDFTFANAMGCGPLMVEFSNNASNYDSLFWEFPGGNPNVSSDENPIVEYSEPGTYNATLYAFNQNGNSTLTQVEAVVVLGNPDAHFDIEMSQDTVGFIDQSVFANEYLWDFGDGGFSEEIAPVHLYESPGTYVVTLHVTNECGTDSTTLEVMIVDGVRRPDFLTKFNIYPNPNGGVFTLDIEGRFASKLHLSFYDVTGRLLKEQQADLHSGIFRENISLEGFPQGIYFLKLDYFGQDFYKKIVVVN